MVLAPWRSPLGHSLHQNRSQPQSRYFQLATVTASGLPTNRTVVFRGFLDSSNQLKIITDSRSRKIDQIKQQPWGEICWYFAKSREQFRLAGNLTIIDASYSDSLLIKERKFTWNNLSDAARLQFAWATPGEPRVKDTAAFAPPPPSPKEPLENFCLLLLNPQKVEYLQLKGDPQNRYHYWLDANQSWQVEEVNP